MGYQTVALGLTLKIPTNGTTNWGTEVLENTWKKISGHNHSGSGNGSKLTKSGLEDNAVDDGILRLRNDQYLRWRNAANSADVNAAKVDADDALLIGGGLQIYNSQVADIVVPVSTASQIVNALDGNNQKLDLTSADTALTVNIENAKAGAWFSILILHGATPVPITWQKDGVAGDVLWQGGQAALLSGDLETNPSGYIDQVLFYSDGSKLYGRWETDFR